MNLETNQKVTANHLKRGAFLYVRQSSMRQVIDHAESTARQYALRQRAIALGWQDEQITVIDSDLGQSGASAVEREGFQRLVTEVSMGRAGIVLGLEVSRLARNSADWHRLLEICAVADTLILDEDGLYDPSHFNDRLLLGLKGTISEAELHVIRSRLRGGLINKVQRGELQLNLPVGYTYSEDGKAIFDPDRQVQEAIARIFGTYRRIGSACGVARDFRRQGLLFPRRSAGRCQPVEWVPPTHFQVIRFLRNPAYTGAYVYGRTRSDKIPQRSAPRLRYLPRDQWQVLILDAHPAYISWQEYEENQCSLLANAQAQGVLHRGPAREGPALLQGILLCAKCGRKMTVGYHTREGRRLPDYICAGPNRDVRQCQRVTGETIDAAIGQLLVESVTPVALEVALTVQQELETRLDEADRLRRAQLERVRYEADLARRRYLHVDPENRLVADTLESDWNEKLRALAAAQEEYQRQRQADQSPLGEIRRAQILDLAKDFPRLWNDTKTPDRERKRMVRLLLEDVTLDNQHADHSTLHVRFRAGQTRTLSLPRPLGYFQARKHSPALVAEIDRLLDDHTYSGIARILNAKGMKTGAGIAFTRSNLSGLCNSYHLKSRFDRLHDKGYLTVNEIAQKLGVSTDTIQRWRKRGLLRTKSYHDGHRRIFEDPGPNAPRKGAHVNKICQEA